MAKNNMAKVLDRLGIIKDGQYKSHFFVIQLDDSDEYAKMYTQLNKYAINTEFPNIGVNTNNTTVKVTNYFELQCDNIDYNIFLIADFDKDAYYIKIGERD